MLASADMNRLALLLLACVGLAACGGSKPKQQNLAPLPEDKPPATAAAEPKKEEPAPEPPKELPPLEVKVEVPAATVKLVSAGKGKKAPLKYTPTAGAKQDVEVVMSFAQTAAMNGQSDEQAVPPIVLTGEAETKSVDANGKAEYAFVISSVDAKPDAKGAVPLDKFKIAIASLGGLVVSGSVDAAGTMTEPVLRIEKPDQFSTGALDLLKTTLPKWPVFPKEPVGVGAKWKATRTMVLKPNAQSDAGIEMTHVTDYELVSKKGSTSTIKAKTTITGKEQQIGDAKITKIGGKGSSEITLEDGALYPSYTTNLESTLTLSAGTESQQHGFKINNTVTAKAK